MVSTHRCLIIEDKHSDHVHPPIPLSWSGAAPAEVADWAEEPQPSPAWSYFWEPVLRKAYRVTAANNVPEWQTKFCPAPDAPELAAAKFCDGVIWAGLPGILAAEVPTLATEPLQRVPRQAPVSKKKTPSELEGTVTATGLHVRAVFKKQNAREDAYMLMTRVNSKGAKPKQKLMCSVRMAGGVANAKELMTRVGQEVIAGKVDPEDKKAMIKRREDLLKEVMSADKARVEAAVEGAKKVAATSSTDSTAATEEDAPREEEGRDAHPDEDGSDDSSGDTPSSSAEATSSSDEDGSD